MVKHGKCSFCNTRISINSMLDPPVLFNSLPAIQGVCSQKCLSGLTLSFQQFEKRNQWGRYGMFAGILVGGVVLLLQFSAMGIIEAACAALAAHGLVAVGAPRPTGSLVKLFGFRKALQLMRWAAMAQVGLAVGIFACIVLYEAGRLPF